MSGDEVKQEKVIEGIIPAVADTECAESYLSVQLIHWPLTGLYAI